jgi:hypothetical protein
MNQESFTNFDIPESPRANLSSNPKNNGMPLSALKKPPLHLPNIHSGFWKDTDHFGQRYSRIQTSLLRVASTLNR